MLLAIDKLSVPHTHKPITFIIRIAYSGLDENIDPVNSSNHLRLTP